MERTNHIKEPEVSGFFYSDDPLELSKMIDDFLQNGLVDESQTIKTLYAIVAPHAGHIYSGPIAGSAYKAMQEQASSIKSVILLGPSHHYPLEGMALHSADTFLTPIGQLEVDQEARDLALQFPCVKQMDQSFKREHSLEVHLPFIKKATPNAQILPIIVGHSGPEDVAALIESLNSLKGRFFIVSTDLSHFHFYPEAKKIDQETSLYIEGCRYQNINSERACGHHPLQGLLFWALQNHLKVKAIDVRNSGDTAGDKQSVVGYGAYLIGL
jgi:MEMO1 family protein